MIARLLTVAGRVQGVGFRYSTAREASRLGVTGWVRNRRNGDVEIYACGNEEAVVALIDWSHHGPQWAQVDTVTVSEVDPDCTDEFIVREDY